MPEVFIIEGPDCAGKTTFGEHIIEEAGRRNLTCLYIHRSRIKTTAREEYLDALEDVRTADSDVVLLDRWHISEDVYGPVMRGESQVDDQLRNEIDATLDDLGATVLYLDTDLDTILDRFNARGDDHVEDAITLARIWQRYYDLATPDWVRVSAIDRVGDLLEGAGER